MTPNSNTNNNNPNSTDFNVFDLFDSQEKSHPDGTTSTEGSSSSSPSSNLGRDLVVVGLVLLGVGVCIIVAVQAFVACRRRKRQRTISPGQDDMMILRRGETNAAMARANRPHLRQHGDEESHRSSTEHIVADE
jgi:hypothetical protein